MQGCTKIILSTSKSPGPPPPPLRCLLYTDSLAATHSTEQVSLINKFTGPASTVKTSVDAIFRKRSKPHLAQKKDIILNTPYHTHTLPDIAQGDYVIAILNVPLEKAGEDEMAHSVHDFFAFKLLLTNESNADNQLWASQYEPSEFVKKWGIESYQNGCLKGKNPLLDIDRITREQPILRVEHCPAKILGSLVVTINSMGWLARRNKKHLVIMAFGPTTAEQDIILDLENAKILTMDMIRKVLPGNIRATIMTPALFSAGWMVNPFLMSAPPSMEEKCVKRMMVRSCGGSLAAHCLDELTHGESPLLTNEGKAQAGGPGGPSMVTMTDEMRTAGRIFHDTVLATIRSRFAKTPKEHVLNLESENDEWITNVRKRLGPNLDHYRKKLSEIPSAVPKNSDAKADADGITCNTPSPLQDFGQAFGGNKISQVNHIKTLIRTFQLVNILDAERPEEQVPGKLFRGFLDLDSAMVSEGQAKEMFSIMEYRFSTMNLATSLVDYLRFPRPMGYRCSVWSAAKSDRLIRLTDQDLYSHQFRALGDVCNVFREMTVDYGLVNEAMSRVDKGREFGRPKFYIGLALGLKTIEEPAEIHNLYREEVKPAVLHFGRLLTDELANVPLVVETGVTYLKSMGFKTIKGHGTSQGEKVAANDMVEPKNPVALPNRRGSAAQAKPPRQHGNVSKSMLAQPRTDAKGPEDVADNLQAFHIAARMSGANARFDPKKRAAAQLGSSAWRRDASAIRHRLGITAGAASHSVAVTDSSRPRNVKSKSSTPNAGNTWSEEEKNDFFANYEGW